MWYVVGTLDLYIQSDYSKYVARNVEIERNKRKGRTKENKNTYPSKVPSFNLKNVFPVICFSLTNAVITRVPWSGSSPAPAPRRVKG